MRVLNFINKINIGIDKKLKKILYIVTIQLGYRILSRKSCLIYNRRYIVPEA